MEPTLLFASAGISSSLMTDERNHYRLSVNGVPQTMLSHYKKVSLLMAATADVSMGYEHTMGRTGRIRVQPYLQFSLRSMGSMQVMSAGVNIAVIKQFR